MLRTCQACTWRLSVKCPSFKSPASHQQPFPLAHPACWAPVLCTLPSSNNAEAHHVLRACLDGRRTGRGIIDHPCSAKCFLLYRHICSPTALFVLDQQFQVHPILFICKARMKRNSPNSHGGSLTSGACSICASQFLVNLYLWSGQKWWCFFQAGLPYTQGRAISAQMDLASPQWCQREEGDDGMTCQGQKSQWRRICADDFDFASPKELIWPVFGRRTQTRGLTHCTSAFRLGGCLP